MGVCKPNPSLLRKGLRQSQAKGFSLVEILVAMTVITTISVVVIGALAPWMSLKQSVDNDRIMNDLKQGIYSKYSDDAMAAESRPQGTFFGLRPSTIDARGNCINNSDLGEFSSYISSSRLQSLRDGFGNQFCVFISNNLSNSREGSTLWYRNIAIVSPGNDGLMSPDTRMDVSTGNITFHEDDVGFLITGHEIQLAKLNETLIRISRVANLYETYFSTRFLAYPDRDITRNYFSNYWDSSGAVPSTGGNWVPAGALLGGIGASPGDSSSAWDTGLLGNNDMNTSILIGNHSESSNGVTVRSPATSGTGLLPYTALVRAKLPNPPGAPEEFVTRVVVGNY